MTTKMRRLFIPTEKQQIDWRNARVAEMPTDEWFKERWKKDHHGKLAGWGMGKRDWIVSNLKNSFDYKSGLWQGRVDKANGQEYTELRIDAPYNLGYYRGYTGWDTSPRGGRNGMDEVTYKWFINEYVQTEEE